MQALSFTLDGDAVTIRRTDNAQLVSACAGSGGYSASELLMAALGSCITASLAPILARHNIDARALTIGIVPRGAELHVGLDVHLTLTAEHAIRQRCQRAAAGCAIMRTLNIPVDIHWQPG